jgi:protochlorophyllide reductase
LTSWRSFIASCYYELVIVYYLFIIILHSVYLITSVSFSGLGYSLTKHLAGHGATVVMACRDMMRGEHARQQLLKENARLVESSLLLMHLDLASFLSVGTFCQAFHQSMFAFF